MLKPCPACGGHGQVMKDCPYCRNTDYFEFSNFEQKQCKCCKDTGLFADTCPYCGGTGYITTTYTSESF